MQPLILREVSTLRRTRRPFRLRLWWQGPRLDGELAAGADPQRDRLLLARANQLVRPRARRSLADAIDAIVDEVERAPRFLSSAAPVRRAEVAEAKASLLGLAEALRAPGAVSPRGVALARVLVLQGDSPLYTDRDGASVWDAARSATRELEEGSPRE